MKNLTLLLVLIVTILACKKEDDDPKNKITYPASTSFGLNILQQTETDSTEIETDTIQGYESYGMVANLEENASLKIVISQQNNPNDYANFWFFDASFMSGWHFTYVDEIYYSQTFEAIEKGDIYMQIYFPNNSKSKIDYYENSDEITYSKMVYVE